MAALDSVKDKIRSLIHQANAATGEERTTLTDAVADLIAGCGGAKVHTGTYSADIRNYQNITFSTPGGASYFAMFMLGSHTTGTGNAFMTSIVCSKNPARVICSCSNNAGSSAASSYAYLPTSTSSVYYGVTFNADSVVLVAPSTKDSTTRAPQVGKSYAWVAW